MGLSDEERQSGMFFSVLKITQLGKILSDKEDYKDLKIYINKLWSSVLSNVSNGSHWILGSSSSNPILDSSGGLWSIAVRSKIPSLERSVLEDVEDKFDPFDGFLDIKGLLMGVERDYGLCFKIYQWIEQLIYYLRRYDDKFLEDYKGTSDLIGSMSGELFDIFQNDDSFARAYILNRILEILYRPYGYVKDDKVLDWLMSENLHHYLSRPMSDRDEVRDLAKIHIDMVKSQKAKTLTSFKRIEIVLKLSGRRYHYDHRFKKLIETFPGIIRGKNRVTLEAVFNNNKKIKVEEDKFSSERYRDMRGGELGIYGIFN